MSTPSSCRSGCPTQSCGSYAACLRSANLRVAYCNSTSGQDFSRQKRWDAELASYRSARAEGIEPAGTTQRQIDQARKISDITGRAFQG